MSGVQRENWWTRPCGGREVLVLAIPLIVSAACWTVMNFVDRMFLFHYSEKEMAAAMPSGLVHFSMICIPLGIASYLNTFVAQYHGTDRPKQIGVATWQGVWLGVLFTPFFLATIPLAPWFFHWIGHAPAMARYEVTYFQVMTFGAGGEVIGAALVSFFTGRGSTRIVLLVDLGAVLLNAVLAYAMIFGHWGLPAMGIAGAGWATVISLWVRVAIYAGLMAQPDLRREYHLVEGCRFDADLTWRLLRFGGPSGLQLFIEMGAFTIFILVLGTLGEQAMAATVLAFNVNSLGWVPMLGLGTAISTVVGQQLGADRPNLASRATWTAFWMSEAYLGLMAFLYVVKPDAFLILYSIDNKNPVEYQQIRDMVVVLLRFVAAYSLLDSCNLIFCSAIKGAGDTRFIFLVTIFVSPLPVVAGWVGIHYLGLGLYWCWVVVTVWMSSLALIYLFRYLEGKWRSMRVIEIESAGPFGVTMDEASTLPSADRLL